MNDNMKRLEARTVATAERALAARKVVTAIDVLQGIGWLPQARVDQWRQGRLAYLERGVSTNLHKISAVMRMFRRWAQSRGLAPRETAYVSRTRDRHQLRFSKSGDLAIERAYRTHWVTPELSAAKLERLAERQRRAPDLVAPSPKGRPQTIGAGSGLAKGLLETAPTGPTVTYAERILDHVWSVAPEGATRGELARTLGFGHSRRCHFGIALVASSAPGIPKHFAFVSPDMHIVGDVKYFTPVGGVGLPPAKFSIIAEHVWPLEKTGAPRTFREFGNDRHVPVHWLERYGEPASAGAFYFLSDAGDLERLGGRGR